MPILNPSGLNVVVSVLGGFMILYGWISIKIKQKWYLGEALPAMVIGIILGPVAGRLLQVSEWGPSLTGEDISELSLGITRIVISVQLVIVGYQLPAQYHYRHWKDLLMCLIPIMTLMWLFTTGCIMATIPKLSLLTALVIASCVTCTDPILSQAVAKGPFADRYVPRHLREIISAEAGVNDGFGFPFLMLAVYLLRFADGKSDLDTVESGRSGGHNNQLMARAEDVDRQAGGVEEAMKEWFVETWFYYCIMGAVYGAVVGTAWRYAIRFGMKGRVIEDEFYVLFPAALGLFLAGTSGALGTNDLIACAAAGHALNWDGIYLRELERRHDEVNESIDVLLNFGGFMYIGAVIPWSDFHDPHDTGITIGRLFGMAFMVFFLRRIPALLMGYKLMPRVVADWREALFMGYFGPIGIGAVFYVEHARHVIPKEGEGDEEMNNLVKAMGPCIYFLVVFSIVGHGLSTPLLAFIYSRIGIKPIQEDAASIRRKSMHQAKPANAVEEGDRFVAYNRFSRPVFDDDDDDSIFSDTRAASTAPSIRTSRSRGSISTAVQGVQWDHSSPHQAKYAHRDSQDRSQSRAGRSESQGRRSSTGRRGSRGRTIRYDDDV